MIRTISIATVFILVMCFIGCSVDHTVESDPSLIPMEVGNSWKYRRVDENKAASEYVITIGGSSTRSFGEVFTFDFSGSVSGRKYYLADDDDILYCGSGDEIFDRPAPIYRCGCDPGEVWDTGYGAMCSLVEKERTVTVPAGEFTCRYFVKYCTDGVKYYERYLCPGVGIVKSSTIVNGNILQEDVLLEYSLKR